MNQSQDGIRRLTDRPRAERARSDRRIRLVAAVALVTAVVFPPWLEAQSVGLRIGVLRGPTAVAFVPVIESGGALPDGRRLEVRLHPTPEALVTAYLAGEVDAATLPSNAVATLYNRGVRIWPVSVFIWGALYLIGPESWTSIEDAAGMIYSIGRGATPDLLLRHVLRARGLEGSVTIGYGYAQVELSQLLIASRVAAAVLPEPFVTRVLLANPALRVVADLQELWTEQTGLGLPQTLLAVRDRRDADALASVLQRSVAEVLADVERAAERVATLGLGLDAPTASAAIPRLNLRFEPLVRAEPALRAYFEALYRLDPASVGGVLPDDAFYRPAP